MMQFDAQTLVAALVATLGVGLLAATGCGNDLGQDKIAQVSLQQPADRAVSVSLPIAPQKQGEGSPIQLQSNGKKPLKITKANLVNAPDRVLHRGQEELESCNYDETNPPTNGDCQSGQYCDQNTKTCRKATVPETPITVSSGSTYEFEFFLAADSEAKTVNCPDPGEEVPDDFKEDYCGELRLETNANTDNSIFQKGNATFYLQVDSNRSGRIGISPENLSFEGLEPGKTLTKEFSVRNDGEGPLTLNSLVIDRHAGFITIDPNSTPITIRAGNSRGFEVEVAVPSDFNMDDLKSTAVINIDSSAVNASPTGETVTLNLNAGTGFGPAAQFDKPAFSFKGGSTDSVTVKNVGQGPLQLNQASFRPSSLSEAYKITFNGEQTGKNLGSADSIPAGESATLKIEYTGSGGDVGRLTIDHNDEALFGQSSLMLLADKSGAVADVIPNNVNFQNKGTSRQVLLYNRGSEPLTIGKKWGNGSAPPEVSISGFSDGDTVAPGEIATGNLEYVTKSEMPKFPVLDFAPSAIDAGNDPNGKLNININPGDGNSRAGQITSDTGDGSVAVGEVARLEFQKGNGMFGDSETLTWMVLDRPSGSEFFSVHQGGMNDPFFVRPDKAGTYKIGVVVVGSGPEIQPTFTLEAKAN